MIGPQTTMQLQRLTVTKDSDGSIIETWAALQNFTGGLHRSKGNERLGADRSIVYSTHVFYIDFPVGVTITEKDRFLYGTRVFDIVIVRNPANMNHHLEIELLEVV